MPVDHPFLPIFKRGALESQPRLQAPASPASPADHTLTRAQNQLVPCVYIALRCSHCGELRQALKLPPPAESVNCPLCGFACSFVLLGSGLTTAQLPFHELHPPAQTRWVIRDVETIDGS